MASITKEMHLAASAETAWALLRDFGAAHLAFPGVLVKCRAEPEGREVTFANGMVVQERILDIDEARRRVAYTVTGGRFAHHSASMQVDASGAGTSRFVWVTDLLPHEAAASVRPLMELGAEAFRRAAEASS